jgi:uncharacterized protein
MRANPLYSRERIVNPFRYSEPVPPQDLLDREREAAALLERAIGGHNSRLVAPRRYGKTSLLRRVMADARAEGWAAVYVDFFGALTAADIAERIELAYADQLEGRLATWFRGVRRMLRPTFRAGGAGGRGPIPAGAEVAVDAQAEPPLLDRLALPRRLHERHGTRTLVVFDEFQDVLGAREGLDATIRSEIQHHGDAASYVFAGSHVGMMRELFADRRRAFYGQAGPVDLPRLDALGVAEYVGERFAASNRDAGPALDGLLDVADGHPQRTMLLAHVLWELTRPGTQATEQIWLRAFDRVMEVTARDELRALWTGLPTGQRRVLTLVAENRVPLYGAAAARALGGSRGGAVRAAVQGLEDRGEIVDAPTVSGHRVVDPLLAAWIRAGRTGGG